jgi:putative transcription factor
LFAMASFSGSQDWNEVSWNDGGKAHQGSKKQELQKAARAGHLEAEKKVGAGGNKQVSAIGTPVNAARLEESEELKVSTVSLELRKLLQQERMKANLKQQELAQACNLKATVIQDYEAGKAIPNSQLLGAMERAIKQKNPEFQLGTFTKAHKSAVDKDKAKRAAAEGADTGKAAPGAGTKVGASAVSSGPKPVSRRF